MTAVFGRISAVIDRRYSLTGRTKSDTVAKRRQSQRRSVSIRREVEKIVVRMKEFRGVVTGPSAATSAEVAVRFHARAIASRDVVRHQIDNRFQTMGVQSVEELLEFG